MAYRIKTSDEAIEAFNGIMLRGRTPRSSEFAEDMEMEEFPSNGLRKF